MAKKELKPRVINIDDLDVQGLKALAYDLISGIEVKQQQLQKVNQQINSLAKTEKTESHPEGLEQ